MNKEKLNHYELATLRSMTNHLLLILPLVAYVFLSICPLPLFGQDLPIHEFSVGIYKCISGEVSSSGDLDLKVLDSSSCIAVYFGKGESLSNIETKDDLVNYFKKENEESVCVIGIYNEEKMSEKVKDFLSAALLRSKNVVINKIGSSIVVMIGKRENIHKLEECYLYMIKNTIVAEKQ